MLGPYVLQIWSRTPRFFESAKPAKSIEWFLREQSARNHKVLTLRIRLTISLDDFALHFGFTLWSCFIFTDGFYFILICFSILLFVLQLGICFTTGLFALQFAFLLDNLVFCFIIWLFALQFCCTQMARNHKEFAAAMLLNRKKLLHDFALQFHKKLLYSFTLQFRF